MTRTMVHPNRPGGRRAFTLTEAVIAVVILAVAVPPMLWAVRAAQAQRSDSAQIAAARFLATERLEDVIADRHSPNRGFAYLVAANYPAEASVSGFPGFARSVALQQRGPDLAATGTGYMVVTVTVSWTDARGVARSMPVSTVLTDYPSS